MVIAATLLIVSALVSFLASEHIYTITIWISLYTVSLPQISAIDFLGFCLDSLIYGFLGIIYGLWI